MADNETPKTAAFAVWVESLEDGHKWPVGFHTAKEAHAFIRAVRDDPASTVKCL